MKFCPKVKNIIDRCKENENKLYRRETDVKDMSPRIVSQTYDNTCEIRLAIRKSEAE